MVRTDAAPATAAAVLGLPWELLHDEAGFLSKANSRSSSSASSPAAATLFAGSPPLRVLAISPRPDIEPTGHPDYRRHTLPLLEALGNLGGLMELQLLNPPTLATLENG